MTLVLGTGRDSFVPLADGDPITLVHGPQGGWHVDAAAAVSASPSDVAAHPRITVPDLGDLELVGDQEPRFLALAAYAETTCAGTALGVQGFADTAQGALSGQDFVCTLRGLPLRYEMTVSDIDGDRSASSSIDVVAALDPIDVPTCDNLSVALGDGAGDAFDAWAEGSPLTLVRHPTDGWIVEVKGRVRRSGPEVSVHPRITVPGLGGLEIVGAEPPVAVTLAGYDPGLGEGTFAVEAVVDTSQGPSTGQEFVCALAGAGLSLEVTVAETDGDGLLTASVEMVAALDPADEAACGE